MDGESAQLLHRCVSKYAQPAVERRETAHRAATPLSFLVRPVGRLVANLKIASRGTNAGGAAVTG
jgi:hypothetical protein